jgi:threonine/homoserine/homoserine lactone efflux protein
MINMFFKGFGFGMLVQFAVGPVCIFIFNCASTTGFINAETAVMAVTLVDGIYIMCAVFGIGAVLRKEKFQNLFHILGALVLFLFGLNIILSASGVNLISNHAAIMRNNVTNSFTAAFILTASNPLTILFWAGLFSTKIQEEHYTRSDLALYSLGAVAPTLIFLSFISLTGVIVKRFLPDMIIKLLNIIIGMMLIFFSIRMFLKLRKKDLPE